jgi:tetratricopeptide (TPR) repeat protein
MRRLVLAMTLGLLLPAEALPTTPGTRILLVARDLDDHLLAGVRFAYAGVTSQPTNQAGAAELDLPPGHPPGQQIKLQLLAGPKQADEWFLVAPQINIPIATVPAEIVLMRRSVFRQIAAATHGVHTEEDSKRAFVETAAQYGLTGAQLETAIRSFAETQNLKDRGIAALLEHHFQIAEELLSQAAERPEDDLVDTLRYVGDAQFQQARYAAAATSFRKALALRADDPVLMSSLGFNLFKLSQWSEAESLMRRALDIDEKTLVGPLPSPVARDLGSLAQLLGATNRLTEAEPLLRRALEIDQKIFGPQHFYVAADLNDLAQILQNTNRLTEAEPLMRRALEIDQTNSGPLRPNVARDFNNLALLLRATNRSAEAEPLMRRALDIGEKSFRANDPRVATYLNNLAEILKDTNHLAEAESLMRRALGIDQISLGPLHPSFARDLNNLGRLLLETNRSAEAEPLMRRALDIVEKSFGPRHPRVAACLNGLALLLEATNRLAEAELLMRRALNIDQESFGPQDPTIARDLNYLAGLLQDTNRLAEAEPLMRHALGILVAFERSTGHEHPKWAAMSNHYRALLRLMGKSEAEPRALLDAVAALSFHEKFALVDLAIQAHAPAAAAQIVSP